MANVLIIEADANLCKAIVEILALAGLEATCARDGMMGITLARELMPALIICDTTLPFLSGFGVLSALADDSDLASIPFILISSHLTNANMKRALQLGANEILLKPFTESELLHMLERLLNHQPPTDSPLANP